MHNVSYRPQNKPLLLPNKELSEWLFFCSQDGVCLLRGTDWVIIYNSTFCPRSVFMCFVCIWEQTAIISLYSINWLVIITETVCLLRGTDWVIIYNSTFCPRSVFMCFVCTWEQTAIISLYSVNWLVFITETECVYCAVRSGSLIKQNTSDLNGLPLQYGLFNYFTSVIGGLLWYDGTSEMADLSTLWLSDDGGEIFSLVFTVPK